ncbi:MAG: biopolymer transporter ExbD [Kiritimatiellae bacterium]|nr:biopolymer transporter ExbD [Kiritimatiellia bacterium]MBR4946378.1 biopolymer transporter ExbD [Kiritimatiellia bacterium]MBR5587391.1 biopolymer transporter ExbD [Kiritimatiellia bacterium]
MAKKKRKTEGGVDLDMTPMIDVVFQLIIFFVVTLKTADSINPDIVLEYGKNGPQLKADEYKVPPVTVEVKRYKRPTDFLRKSGSPTGRVVSINGAVMSLDQMRVLLRNISKTRGTNFPLLIRADKDTPHEDVRAVMNVCNEIGIWQVSFLAMVKPGDSSKQ